MTMVWPWVEAPTISPSHLATDFLHPMGGTSDPTTWRYTVQLDSGEAFKVKTASVRAEGAGGGAGAGNGKAKGKGKKGRAARK